MQRGLQMGGWKRLNALFDDPPTTTREIFEPEEYFEKQPPAKVVLPRPPCLEGRRDLTFLADNILGELGYYALLGQILSEDEAKSLTPHLLADRYLLYERSDGQASGVAREARPYTLVCQTHWATAEAALAFFRDYQSILAHKYTALAPDSRSTPDLFIGSAPNGQIMLLHKGGECLWAEGIPPAQSDAMLAWLNSR
jgi:hypothetical protein